MRRDILELDTAMAPVFKDLELSMMDVEAVRLVLAGGSVVDWTRMAFTGMAGVDRFLSLARLDLSDPVDHERLVYVFNEAMDYLVTHLRLRFPKYLRHPDDVRDIFLWASEPKGFRRRQMLSCVVLKLMHVIHHMEAADLKYKVAISEEELFDLAETDVLRLARTMREAGLPVLSFNSSRKSRSSVITKLISKKENIAATIFDKLRFRVVVRQPVDLVPVLSYMVRNFFPFNYAIPGESHNNLLDPAVLSRFLANPTDLQELIDKPSVDASGKNEFSSEGYRMINFIVDYPVVLPREMVPGFGFELGRVVFLMAEFQIVDEQTARDNEMGPNAHHLYKKRQRRVVSRRLTRGGSKSRGKKS